MAEGHTVGRCGFADQRRATRLAGDGNLDPGAVFQRLFDGCLTLPAGLEFDHFHRIGLQKPVELDRIAPEGTNVKHIN